MPREPLDPDRPEPSKRSDRPHPQRSDRPGPERSDRPHPQRSDRPHPERSQRAQPESIEKGTGSKSERYGRFSTHHPLVELATVQHGVVSLAQLKASGITARGAQKRVAAGPLHRVYQGVYSLVPPQLLTLRARYMAAVLACGPGAVLSHRSAAALHGLRATSRSKIEVTVPGRNRRRHEGVEVHRSTTLTAADVTTVDEIPVTTIARTVADLTGVLPERAVERALEQGAVMEVLDGRALDDQLTRHPRAARLRRLLARGALASPTEGKLEELFLKVCATAGVPEPERQVYIDPDDGAPMVRADFLWRDQRLIVEADSAKFHGTRRSFESDRRRDQRLMLAGWRVIRVTWRQLTERPQEVVALLRRLLGGEPS